MNNQDEIRLNSIRSRIVVACEQYGLGKFSHRQWKELIEFALKESNDIVHKPLAAMTLPPQKTVEWSKSCAIIDWCHKHKILLRKSSIWRWIGEDEVTGMIWGLPSINGTPRITNGIDVYIERADGTVFKGHMDWFIRDLIPKSVSNKPKQTKTKKRVEIQFDELFA